MLKAAVRLSHTKKIALNEVADGQTYERRSLLGESIDEKRSFSNITFRLFLFADCGMKKTVFKDCVFKDCTFSGCYLVQAEFSDCKFQGCQFEICAMRGIKLKSTSFEFLEFFRCVLPHHEMIRNLGDKHASNDVMLLNCAAEARRIGQWQQADVFFARHLKEKRLNWLDIVLARRPYDEKPRKSTPRRLRSLFRLVTAWTLSILLGDKLSIRRFLFVGSLFSVIAAPIIVFVFSQMYSEFQARSLLDHFLVIEVFYQNYFGLLSKYVDLSLGTNITQESMNIASGSEWLTLVFRILGVLYLAILANILTKSLGKGPSW